MIRIEITTVENPKFQGNDQKSGLCEITAYHAQDGEFPAYSETTEYEGTWVGAVTESYVRYGDEISSLEVTW